MLPCECRGASSNKVLGRFVVRTRTWPPCCEQGARPALGLRSDFSGDVGGLTGDLYQRRQRRCLRSAERWQVPFGWPFRPRKRSGVGQRGGINFIRLNTDGLLTRPSRYRSAQRPDGSILPNLTAISQSTAYWRSHGQLPVQSGWISAGSFGLASANLSILGRTPLGNSMCAKWRNLARYLADGSTLDTSFSSTLTTRRLPGLIDPLRAESCSLSLKTSSR